MKNNKFNYNNIILDESKTNESKTNDSKTINESNSKTRNE